MINRKIPWTSQPQYPVQIDWSNPLTQGLVGLFDSVNGIDLVDGGFPSTNSVTRGVISKGRIANFSNSAQIYPHKPRYATTGALTIFTPLVVTSLANYSGILSKSSNYLTFPFELRLGSSPTTSEIDFQRGGGGVAASAFKGSGSLISANPGVVQYLAVRCISGDLNTAPDVFVNKTKTTLARNGYNIITGTAADNGSSLRVGNRFDTTTYLNGGIQYLGLWNRALSDSEILSLSDNPWQIFQAQSRRIFVASAGGDVSLSITGQSLTANLGALSASVTSSVTGNQTTLQQGTITANVSQTLTGQAISLVQGSVSSDVSTVITGQTVSLAQGSVTDASSGNVTKALSGQSLSVSQGALTASISLALNGQSIVLSGGSVSPAISSALAGQQASVQQGNVSANISAGLTGQAAVISNGTVFQAGSDVTKALTGQQLSIALGVLLEKKTIARPSSDTTAGAWLPSAGSSLYATLDEVSPDDADYIYTNSVSTCKIALNAVADPLTSSGQIVSYRVWSPNSNGLTVRLMQGATEIASWTHTVLPTSPTTYQQTLTAGQCDAITDYSTLAIQLESV